MNQAALFQGFPKDWEIIGRKAARYRQVIGQASPLSAGETLGLATARARRS